MVASGEGACYVRRAGRMTCTRPAALNYNNPRAHWPKVSVAWGQVPISIWALKGATHCNRATRSNYLTPTLLALFEARSGSCSLSPPAIVSNHSNPIGAAVSLMTFIRHNMPDICQTLTHEVKRDFTGIDLAGSSEGGDNTGSLPHRHA